MPCSADRVHQRRADGLHAHTLQVRGEQSLGRATKAVHLPPLHAESLDDAVARDGFVQDVLDLRQLVLPGACGGAHAAADATRGGDNDRHKQQQHPGQLTAIVDGGAGHEHERKNLLQSVAEHGRHSGLHTLDVVDQGRQQGARGVLLEERSRAPQHRAVQVVAQVGNHAEAGVVDQVGAAVIAYRLEQRGRDQRVGHDRPGVVKVAGNEEVQIERSMEAWQRKAQQIGRTRIGIEHLIEDRLDEHHAQRRHGAHHGQQHYGRDREQRVRPHVAEQAPYPSQAVHRPAERSVTRSFYSAGAG